MKCLCEISIITHTFAVAFSIDVTSIVVNWSKNINNTTNRISYNTLTVLTLPFSLQWRTTRRMGPSPSWTPLSNQRWVENCLSLCTGNLPTLTSTYSGTVTTTSQPSLVLSTSSPIGSKQYVAILSFSKKRRPTSGMH